MSCTHCIKYLKVLYYLHVWLSFEAAIFKFPGRGVLLAVGLLNAPQHRLHVVFSPSVTFSSFSSLGTRKSKSFHSLRAPTVSRTLPLGSPSTLEHTLTPLYNWICSGLMVTVVPDSKCPPSGHFCHRDTTSWHYKRAPSLNSSSSQCQLAVLQLHRPFFPLTPYFHTSVPRNLSRSTTPLCCAPKNVPLIVNNCSNNNNCIINNRTFDDLIYYLANYIHIKKLTWLNINHTQFWENMELFST